MLPRPPPLPPPLSPFHMVGPHNGDGGPGDGRLGNCSGNRVCGRFGSTLWYADSMASKAVAGYAAFCRQECVIADLPPPHSIPAFPPNSHLA